MPHKTHHIQSMYYQSNQWMLSNVSVWWQNVVTMMYSLQWGIASYHLAVRYCSLQGLLGQKTEGIILPGMAHSTTSSPSLVWGGKQIINCWQAQGHEGRRAELQQGVKNRLSPPVGTPQTLAQQNRRPQSWQGEWEWSEASRSGTSDSEGSCVQKHLCRCSS